MEPNCVRGQKWEGAVRGAVDLASYCVTNTVKSFKNSNDGVK